MNKAGRVFWFTGLAGSGKTTLATALIQELKTRGVSPIFLDGDQLRPTLAEDLGYEAPDRLKAAKRYARLCHLLASQGFTVVCATISLFNEVQDWNRQNTSGYVEIYVTAPPAVIAQRDQKRLYSGAAAGRQTNVAGVNLAVEFPKNPDYTLTNTGEEAPEQLIRILLEGA